MLIVDATSMLILVIPHLDSQTWCVTIQEAATLTSLVTPPGLNNTTLQALCQHTVLQ